MALGFTSLGAGYTMVDPYTSGTGATKYFKKISMANETTVCVQVNWDAAWSTTLKIQGSNYENPTDEAAGATDEWIDLDVVPNRQPAAGSERGCYFNMSFVGFRWIRVSSTSWVSGTPNVTIRTVQKTPNV